MATNEASTESAQQNEADATEAPARAASKRSAKRTAKKTAKKASKKVAKKTEKKSAKKTAKKAVKKSAEKAAKKPAAPKSAPESAPNPYADFDRSQLSDKIRVFTLAKLLGVTSKELVVALGEIGLVKVAQSTLTRAEAEQLLDALSNAPTQPTAPAADDEADEKIRHRVRKDVENEIHQIEKKVDEELATEPEHDDVLTDIEPEITPAPEDPSDDQHGEQDGDKDGDAAAAPHAPVFRAPSRSKRRRASRASTAQTETADAAPAAETADVETAATDTDHADTDRTETEDAPAPSRSRRRRNRRSKAREEQVREVESDGVGEASISEGPEEAEDIEQIEEPKAIKGSSRLEAQRRRRSEKREEQRKRSRIVSQAEFLARRESVERHMVVRERDRHDGRGRITQVGVLEDGLLVEHFVTSEAQASMVGNIYLGRVQNVLPSMEAAFIDIGQGRNGVLYASEVDWKAAGLGGRSRRIEQALKSGDQVLVQVTKDPVGHKGARLSTQISLAGRYLVYVPGGRSAGISRKLPAPERKRLKEILNNVVPGQGGAIIRTAAEGVSEDAIAADVNRLHNQWTAIQERAEKEKHSKGAKPVTLYEEPNLLVKVVRDLFNEDFTSLVVDGKKAWNTVHAYVQSVAPDLLDRVEKFDRDANEGKDAFDMYRVDEQIQKALSRVVWLPSGGTLVIDRTEAMTVIDVNTGKFTGSGGSLEETVTSNNLEAAEEIVRQIRLRDIGGMIIIDFIDMILPENQELVLRRLNEALGRDRTRHQVSEVTSLGLVQMTRKRLGTGLLETFSTTCEHCEGRGVIIADDPVDHDEFAERGFNRRGRGGEKPGPRQERKRTRHEEDAVDNMDELIDSIVASEGETPEDAVPEGAASSDGKRRSRRRGRRGGSRGRGRADNSAERAGSDEAAVEAADEAGDTGRGSGSVRDDQPAARAEKTYEEAVEEFESSPRRKRRTRGNSRSDQRPKREDFAEREQKAEKSAHAKDAEAAETKDVAKTKEVATREQEPATRVSGTRRGRRRATRKLSGGESAQNATQARAESAKREDPEAGAGKRREAKAPTSSRRGRRRATRKRNDD